MSFLRRLAAASNPPRIPNPNPANPVLVSVVPVLAKRCPTLAFVSCALEFPFVASDPAFASVPAPALEFPSAPLPLLPLLAALASTKSLAGITTFCPSG